MRISGLSKPKFFIPETGQEGELSIEQVSSSLEIDSEFKTDFEFDLESFNKSLERNFAFELLERINMNWLAGATFVYIYVPNEDVRKKINLVLSGKKAAFYELFYIISVTIDKK